MKLIFLLFVVFAAAQCASIADTDEEDHAWSAFKAQYAKKYNSDVEEEFRMKIFMENKLKIDKHNQEYEKGLVSYSQGINKFSDMLHSEFIATHTGFKYTSHINLKGATFISSADTIPKSINWTDQGAVTRVKDQGYFGQSWPFSATGALEGQVFITNGKLVALSEQCLVDCSKQNSGSVDKAFEDIMDMGGIDTEESYPYEGGKGECKYDPKNSGATVIQIWFILQHSEEVLMEALAAIGPISVGVQTTQRFQSYRSGVFYDPTCSGNDADLNHNMLAVGYGTDESTGMDYYLVKNSWGSDWGDNGYIWMARNKDNNCGIATNALFPLVKPE